VYLGEDNQGFFTESSDMKTIIVAALLLAACVTTSKVVPAGKDSFMIVASVDCANCTPSQVRAVDQANAYCGTLSKFMVIRRMNGEKFDLGIGNKTTLIFSCLDKSDPEYTRPNLQADPH
jgi:hypothetical protein